MLRTTIISKTKLTLNTLKTLNLSRFYGKKASLGLFKMKLDEEKMSTVRTPNVVEMSKMFARYGYEIRIVGGAVRDLLNGTTPTDLDFATTATPTQMITMFTSEEVRMLNMKGERHGTITVRHNEENFEFTTLRIDVITDGRHAEVKFITDWELDAERRDLTINSLYLGLNGDVYDYFDGVKHIKEKHVQFVGDADKRIQEDYLRILRYFRFYGLIAKCSEKHDPNILKSIQKNAVGLAKISGERIWSEMAKIMKSNIAYGLLETMKKCDLFPYIGLPVTFDCDNIINVYKNIEKSGLILTDINHMTLLASGFRTMEECTRLVERVKCGNKEKDLLYCILEWRNKVADMDDFKYVQDMLMNMILLKRIQHDRAVLYVTELLKYTCKIEYLKLMENWEVPRFPVNGHKLKIITRKRKDIGTVQKQLVQMWIDSNYNLNEHELLESLKDSDLCFADQINIILTKV